MTPRDDDAAAQRGHLVLRPELPLRMALATAMHEILAYGSENARAAADQDGSDAASADRSRAVHEYRKSLRRARAVLRLCQRLLPDGMSGSLARALADLARATSVYRDRDVLQQALRDWKLHAVTLPEEDRPSDAPEHPRTTSETPLPTLEAGLGDQTLRKEGTPEGLDDQTLRKEGTPEGLDELMQGLDEILCAGALALDPIAAAFASALPDKVRWRDLSKGLERSYRRTRRSSRKAMKDPCAEHTHGWRKRTKELTYQVELLASLGSSRRLDKLRTRLTRLSDRQGKIMDLDILYRSSATHTYGDGKDRLLAAIEDRQAALLQACFRQGSKTFRESSSSSLSSRKAAKDIIAQARAARRRTRKALREITDNED